MSADNFVSANDFAKVYQIALPESVSNQPDHQTLSEALEEWQKSTESNAFPKLLDLTQAHLAAEDGAVTTSFMKNLFILLCAAAMSNIDEKSIGFMPHLCESIANLDADHRIQFQELLTNSLKKEAQGKAQVIFQKLVACFQSFIMLAIAEKERISSIKDSSVVNAVLCLEILHEINDAYKYVPFQSFYNPAIEASLNLKEDYPKWKSNQGFSFLDSPFLLSTTTKADILKIESMINMRHELQDAFFRAMFIGVNSPYLQLEVRRDHVVRDAILQISAKSPHDLRKQLRVSFVGEEGIDEGGIQKEFFQMIFRNIFDAGHGMFEEFNESRLYWFSKNLESLDNEVLEEYILIGKLFGLALYNGITLDVHFPLALYKKILKIPVALDDLQEFDPLLWKGLKDMLEFDGNVEETYCYSFEATYSSWYRTKTADLRPGGSEIRVTNENKEEFVTLYVDFIINQSVSAAFSAFMEGFDCVVERGALLLFRPEEFQELVVGCEKFDFLELEKASQYDGGFSAESTFIKDFWEVVHGFSNEDKRRLLFFVTGSDRVPAGGLSKLQFIISRNGPDTDRLPTSHTCYNVLLLNEYSDRGKLEERLKKAMENSNCGFFLI
ncbi:putative E3 ubiquitin-protein ligase HTD2 [Dinochytrium kinnereticum]|nr:putative E3 ubiquitin-protein ligase HTD2 [Dinochytrium kinnereticum]